MKKDRVFISPIVQGYEDRRVAAREAIESAGGTPVLAEDAPPAAGPPRQVVLDELLGSCDALVGIYGTR